MMFPKPKQGWIHGLPGHEAPEGVPVEVVEFTPPKPGKEGWFSALYSGFLRLLGFSPRIPLSATELNFTILAAPEVRDGLRKLAGEKTAIPRLSLVVRMDEVKRLDDEYQMGNATIASALPAMEPRDAAVVNAHAERITARMGISVNPGPPSDAPEIQLSGMNTGWVFARRSRYPEKGMAVEVEGFTPPDHDGRLVVHLGEPSPVIEGLTRSRARKAELILVLPDRAGRRYVEFKLRDVRSVKMGERQVAFESRFIEWLTGEGDDLSGGN